MNIARLMNLVEMVTLECSRKIEPILRPGGNYVFDFNQISRVRNSTNAEVKFDTAQWKIPESQKQFVEELRKNSNMSNEEKIIKIHEALSKEYTYDDNILTYIRKNEDDNFELPEWYGKNVDEKWEKERNEHNRRVCYEMSRYLAESLAEIFRDNKDIDACVLWDENLTHYFVGLSGKDYSLTLDLDDFEKIKDLTRVKTGLTIEGISVLEDQHGKFTRALNAYNRKKERHAIRAMNKSINKVEKSNTESTVESDDVIYLRNAVSILVNEYDLDPSGIFEYMKEIVDIKLGSPKREKVWKLRDKEKDLYTRCIIIYIDDKKYVIDVEEKVFRECGENEEYIPFKQMSRNWDPKQQ